MTKLYGKLWAEGNPGKMSTRCGHNALSIQLLYGNKSDSRIALEATVKCCPHGKFRLELEIPSENSITKIALPFD